MPSFSTFEQQVDAHEDRIFRFARSFVKDRATAQDITQDVLITLWEHQDDVEGDRLSPWLMQVTRNACIDKLRRRQTRHRTMTVDTENVARAASDQPSPEATTEIADFEEHLHAALDRIDEPYRSVVELRELHELKYREIADRLDMPLNTVKVYIHRGRKKLRAQLDQRLDMMPA